MGNSKNTGIGKPLLGISSSKRWLTCPPSARLEYGIEESRSKYADEGTLAHSFGEFALRLANDEITEGRYEEAVARLKKHELYAPEMDAFVQVYVDYVLERYHDTKREDPDTILIVEEKLFMGDLVSPKLRNGIADATIVGNGQIEVVDFKYGRGVKVEVENNPQARLYSLGTVRLFDIVYDIEQLTSTIVQPRLHHIASETISISELEHWVENTLMPGIDRADKSEGNQKAGDHCRFCKVRHKCRAFANLANDAARHDFAEPELLTDDELLELFESLPLLKKWLESVAAYLLEEAKKGRKFPGYKLVAGKTSRKWSDPTSAAIALRGMGFETHQIYNSKIKGIGDVSQLMAVDVFEKKMLKFITRPEGAPTLVPESDKRPALGSESAKQDFAEPID